MKKLFKKNNKKVETINTNTAPEKKFLVTYDVLNFSGKSEVITEEVTESELDTMKNDYYISIMECYEI